MLATPVVDVSGYAALGAGYMEVFRARSSRPNMVTYTEPRAGSWEVQIAGVAGFVLDRELVDGLGARITAELFRAHWGDGRVRSYDITSAGAETTVTNKDDLAVSLGFNTRVEIRFEF